MNQHSDPSRPLRQHDAAASPKRPARPATDLAARRQRMDHEREQLRRNRHIEQQLDHALIESFPAGDPLAVTPEGLFPVRDPQLAADAPDAPDAPDAGDAADARDARQAPRRAQAQAPQQPVDPAALPPEVPGDPRHPRPPEQPEAEPAPPAAR